MPNFNIDISIIIVNYKGWSYLNDALEALIKMDQSKLNFEVIIVDNCSNDGQIELFTKKYNSVNFYVNNGNFGFANGCNYGAKKAKGKFLLFLNPDTIANQEALLKMIETYEKHPDLGALTCSQINQKGNFHKLENIFYKPQTMFGFFRILYRLFNKSKLSERFDKSKNLVYPDWISGSVVFISRQWFDKIGGWDEAFWMYYEDMDLCKRLSNNGAKIGLLQNVNIKHYHGGSSRINYDVKALTKSEVIKSRHVYIDLHFTGFTRFLLHTLTMTYQLISKFIMGMLGLFLFFIPKFKTYLFLAQNIFKYYSTLPFKNDWKSKKAIT